MPTTTNNSLLLDEIQRYLAAVDLFRELGCAPTWEAEERHRPPSPVTVVLAVSE